LENRAQSSSQEQHQNSAITEWAELHALEEEYANFQRLAEQYDNSFQDPLKDYLAPKTH
jgi:hypothetical protein